MPLYGGTTTANPLAGPTLAFFGGTGSTQPTGYSWSPAVLAGSKNLPGYTANVQSTAYTGGLLDLTQALRLSDGNTMRVALENLRVFTESLAKQHNQLCTDLIALGLIAG